jgi:hypothetical protein
LHGARGSNGETAKKKERPSRSARDRAQARGHISSDLVQSGRAPVTRRIEHRP